MSLSGLVSLARVALNPLPWWERWRLVRLGVWQMLLFGAEILVLAASPDTYRLPAQRQRFLRHLTTASMAVLWPFLLAVVLFGVVIIRIVVDTAASYGLSQYALEVVVRTLVLELIPLGAALFVAVRSALPAAQAWRRQLAALMRQQALPSHGQVLMRELAPRAFAMAFAVLLLCGLASALMLVMSYLTVYGLSPWGWAYYTQAVGGVFTPVVTLIFVLKTLGLALAVAVVPLASGAWSTAQALPQRRSDMAEFARLAVVLLLIEAASLVGNYY